MQSELGAALGLSQDQFTYVDVAIRTLPQDATGLLLYLEDGAISRDGIKDIVAEAIDRSIPVLGVARGMHVLNQALGGLRPRQASNRGIDVSGEGSQKSLFLAPGAKVSSTIGGSGWLRLDGDFDAGITHAEMSPAFMASAVGDDTFIHAIEMPGHHWVIGVQWDLILAARGAIRLPRGFDSLLMAFVERVKGEW